MMEPFFNKAYIPKATLAATNFAFISNRPVKIKDKPMTEQFNLIKQKAAELKKEVEALLTKFREETGYTPDIKVETKVKPTNDRTFVSQTVHVTVTVQ